MLTDSINYFDPSMFLYFDFGPIKLNLLKLCLDSVGANTVEPYKVVIKSFCIYLRYHRIDVSWIAIRGSQLSPNIVGSIFQLFYVVFIDSLFLISY